MKRAVITGAGTGIGKATAAWLIERDYEVIGVGRTQHTLEGARGELGERFTPLAVDVRAAGALRSALAGRGPFHAVVANAGLCRRAGVADEDADEVWEEVIGINLHGVWNTFRATHAELADDGRAVVVSSGLGKLGRPGYGAYAASKHAVLGLTKCLSKELAARRITVNAVCPGWVDTAMARADVAKNAEEAGSSWEEAYAQATAPIPLGRFVTESEAAELIGWLLSDASSGMTGQALNISCGEFFA